jgi:hypothetical protein
LVMHENGLLYNIVSQRQPCSDAKKNKIEGGREEGERERERVKRREKGE